jgi:lysophospholipase L1-like esterase
MLATYLQRRNPALIVLAYGTNEAGDPGVQPDAYQTSFSTLLQRLRAAAPVASIVVLGPPDRLTRTKGAWNPHPGLDGIIAAQQAACRENRCAFWDSRRRMGGKGSMRDWVYAGMAQGDYVHFTSAGYIRMAETFYQNFIGGYEVYRKTHAVNSEQEHGKAN